MGLDNMKDYKKELEQMENKQVFAEFNNYVSVSVLVKQLRRQLEKTSGIPLVISIAIRDLIDVCDSNLYLIREELSKRDDV